MSEFRLFPVPEGLVGERADIALSRMLGVSRSAATKMLERGDVRAEGSTVTKGERLRGDMLIEVNLKRAQSPPELATELEVLYQDQDLIVINKPVGVAAHGGPGWDGPTVTASLEAAGARLSTSGPPERKGIVQRLDVGTTGAMIVAKSELAYSKLKHAFRERQVEKTYHALVEGHPDPPRGTIDAPIGRHPSRSWRMAVMEGGRNAVTHYDTLELLPGAALLEVDLETGRTHQIRVHMASMGHPCVGDTFYGGDPTRGKRLGLTRQWLHAADVKFRHPATGETLRVSAPYPPDLAGALETLRSP